MELTIQVNKNELLLKLKENRERYKKTYEALIEAYKLKVEDYKKKYAEYVQLELNEENEDRITEHNPYAPTKPTNYTKTYDFYIEMVETNIGKLISLNEHMYRKLWLDKFEWTTSFGGECGSYFALAHSGEIICNDWTANALSTGSSYYN